MQHPHAVTRDNEPEAGFTLIELMMVVLIIAILIAVLIPTFVGAKQRAQDRAMQSSMRNALTAAKVVYSERGDYTQATVAGLDEQPSLESRSSTRRRSPTGPERPCRSIPVSTSYFVIAGQSRSGTCFFLSDDESTAGARRAQYARLRPVPAVPRARRRPSAIRVGLRLGDARCHRTSVARPSPCLRCSRRDRVHRSDRRYLRARCRFLPERRHLAGAAHTSRS